MEVAILVLQLSLIIVFSITGIRKVTGTGMYQRTFLKNEFRILVGFMEIVAAICLILGFFYEILVMYGALIIVVMAIGRIRTHFRVTLTLKELPPILIFLAALALVLLFLVVE